MHSTGPWTAMVTDTMGDTPALWDIVQRSSGDAARQVVWRAFNIFER